MAKRNPAEKPDFYKHYTIEELAEQQGVKPINKKTWQEMKAIADELWPDEESVKEFQAFVREIRGKKPAEN